MTEIKHLPASFGNLYLAKWELYLHYFIAENRKTWVDLLPWAEFSYNTTFHTSIGMALFKVVYGCDPPTLIVYELDDVNPIPVAEFLQQRDKVLQ